jgi:hypothetical protein
MLYCSVHHRLYVGSLQKWIPFSDDQLLNLRIRSDEIFIEGTCSECVYLAKESIRLQFPDLYAHLPA